MEPNWQHPGQEDWGTVAGYTGAMSGTGGGYYPSYCYPIPTVAVAGPPPFGSFAPVYMGMQPMYVPMMGVPCFLPDQYEQQPPQQPDMAMSRPSRRRRGTARPRLHENEDHSPDHKPACGLTSKQESGDPSVTFCGQAILSLDSKDLLFLLAKQLSPSGVNSLGRIVLPKKEAEAHLPYLAASEGVLLTMADFDTRQRWTFRYRFWSNNKSRMYLLENTRDFVKAHNLQERDMLVLYKDAEGSYVVRGAKIYGASSQSCDSSCDIAAADEIATMEEEISRKEQTLEFLI